MKRINNDRELEMEKQKLQQRKAYLEGALKSEVQSFKGYMNLRRIMKFGGGLQGLLRRLFHF